MAVSSNPVSSDLILIMDNGTGASGQPLTKARKFSKVQTTASNEDIYAVANTLTDLQSKTRIAVRRQDTVEIEEL